MHLFHGYLNASTRIPPLVYAIGNFDGVHLGHESLIARAKEMSQERGVNFGVYTFWPHPRAVLNPKLRLKLIATREQKLARFEALGVAYVVEEPFTLEFAALSGQAFCEDVVAKNLKAVAVVTGENFRFGHHAVSTPSDMTRWLSPFRIQHVLAPSISIDGEVCSSSRVREFVLLGQVEHACKMLGRPYSIVGKVIAGAGRGHTIGVPTANLEPASTLIPPSGVYATSVGVNGEVFKAATNIGTRPTFSASSQVYIESHLLNFDRDIYDAQIEIFFHRKIRDERKFDSVDTLKCQIEEDLRLSV